MEMLEIRNPVTDMKNGFDGLNSVEEKNLVTLKIDQFLTLGKKHPWEKNRTERP